MSSTLWWQDGKGDPTKLEKLNQCTGSEQRLKNFTQSPDRWPGRCRVLLRTRFVQGLRARLLTAIDRIAAPVFFIHAENDYSLSSGKVLDARRERIGKPHRLKIYPPIGHTVDDGHDFLHLGVSIWEPDVSLFWTKTCGGEPAGEG